MRSISLLTICCTGVAGLDNAKIISETPGVYPHSGTRNNPAKNPSWYLRPVYVRRAGLTTAAAFVAGYQYYAKDTNFRQLLGYVMGLFKPESVARGSRVTDEEAQKILEGTP